MSKEKSICLKLSNTHAGMLEEMRWHLKLTKSDVLRRAIQELYERNCYEKHYYEAD